MITEQERREIEAFLYLEARLADESAYEAWEALVTDDVHYWVPYGKADYEPSERMSYINDNRTRLATRIRQLGTGRRHAQTPPSSMRRVISNIEILDHRDGEYVVAGNFVLFEHAIQATHSLRVWAGRTTYRLRRVDNALKMAGKTDALPTLAFIL
jgi:benzoate/toluate 1,2-dioxygenase beta subunit